MHSSSSAFFSFCEVQAWFLAIKAEVLFLEFIIGREKCQHSEGNLFIKCLFTPQCSNSNSNNKRKLEKKKRKNTRLHKNTSGCKITYNRIQFKQIKITHIQ